MSVRWESRSHGFDVAFKKLLWLVVTAAVTASGCVADTTEQSAVAATVELSDVDESVTVHVDTSVTDQREQSDTVSAVSCVDRPATVVSHPAVVAEATSTSTVDECATVSECPSSSAVIGDMIPVVSHTVSQSVQHDVICVDSDVSSRAVSVPGLQRVSVSADTAAVSDVLAVIDIIDDDSDNDDIVVGEAGIVVSKRQETAVSAGQNTDALQTVVQQALARVTPSPHDTSSVSTSCHVLLASQAHVASQTTQTETSHTTDTGSQSRVTCHRHDTSTSVCQSDVPTARVIGHIVNMRCSSPPMTTAAHTTATTATHCNTAVMASSAAHSVTTSTTSTATSAVVVVNSPVTGVTTTFTSKSAVGSVSTMAARAACTNVSSVAKNGSTASRRLTSAVRRPAAPRASRPRRVAVLRPKDLYEISSQIVAEVLHWNKQSPVPDVITCDDDDGGVVDDDCSNSDDVVVIDKPVSDVSRRTAGSTRTDTSGHLVPATSKHLVSCTSRHRTTVPHADTSRCSNSNAHSEDTSGHAVKVTGECRARVTHIGTSGHAVPFTSGHRSDTTHADTGQHLVPGTSGRVVPYASRRRYRVDVTQPGTGRRKALCTNKHAVSEMSNHTASTARQSGAAQQASLSASAAGNCASSRKLLLIPDSSSKPPWCSDISPSDDVEVVDADNTVICCDEDSHDAALEMTSVDTVPHSRITAADVNDDDVLMCDTPGLSESAVRWHVSQSKSVHDVTASRHSGSHHINANHAISSAANVPWPPPAVPASPVPDDVILVEPDNPSSSVASEMAQGNFIVLD